MRGDAHELARCGLVDSYAIEQLQELAALVVELVLGLLQVAAGGDSGLDRPAKVGADDLGPLLDRRVVAQRARDGHLLEVVARGFEFRREYAAIDGDDL